MSDMQKDMIMKVVLILVVIVIMTAIFGTIFPLVVMEINISYIIIAAFGILVGIGLYKTEE